MKIINNSFPARFLKFFLFFLFNFFPSFVFTQKPLEHPVFEAMSLELKRSMKQLKLENFFTPYFLSYQLLDSTDTTINARNGAITFDQTQHARYFYVELRYGNYEKDNTGESYRGVFEGAALEDNLESLRHALWLMTDQAYKQAVKAYLEKQGKKISEVQKEDLPDFSKEKPHHTVVRMAEDDFPLESYKEILKNISAEFKKYKEILDSGITLRKVHRKNYLLNSEGTRLLHPGAGNSFQLYLWAKTMTEDGMNLEVTRPFSFRSKEKGPSQEFLMKKAQEIVDQLLKLRVAKITDPYTAPALLDGESTGVLFHEALGHRLEGERQRDEDEGQTFKGQIGKEIIPSFLSVEDDPTLMELEGEDLNGFYEFDDEGIRAQRVVLVEKGILKNYLLSRRPIKDFYHSNGHGRAQFGRDPIGRMSNLIVKSSLTYPLDSLKNMLLEECRKQKKPYGFLIKRIRSGDTFTGRGRYQAFRGTPEAVYLVDAQTGAETLVRGVEIVGTPLITVNRILATSDFFQINNAFCGAESGLVPVSTIAPYSLVQEVELQRLPEEKSRPPILSPPFFSKGAEQ